MMTQKNKITTLVKNYISGWNFIRVFRLLLSLGLFAGYFYAKESIYLLGGIIIGIQAVLNVGCPGMNCNTRVPDNKNTPVMKFEELKINKKKNVQ